MNAEDIKATVWDYAIDKCTPKDIVRLQRYFLKEYMSWLPLRAIAEYTGTKDHTKALDSIRAVGNSKILDPLVTELTKIFDKKMGNHWLLGNQYASKTK